MDDLHCPPYWEEQQGGVVVTGKEGSEGEGRMMIQNKKKRIKSKVKIKKKFVTGKDTGKRQRKERENTFSVIFICACSIVFIYMLKDVKVPVSCDTLWTSFNSSLLCLPLSLLLPFHPSFTRYLMLQWHSNMLQGHHRQGNYAHATSKARIKRWWAFRQLFVELRPVSNPWRSHEHPLPLDTHHKSHLGSCDITWCDCVNSVYSWTVDKGRESVSTPRVSKPALQGRWGSCHPHVENHQQLFFPRSLHNNVMSLNGGSGITNKGNPCISPLTSSPEDTRLQRWGHSERCGTHTHRSVEYACAQHLSFLCPLAPKHSH